MEEEILDELKEEFQTLQSYIYHRDWEMAKLQIDYMESMSHLMDISMYEELIIANARVEWMLNSE